MSIWKATSVTQEPQTRLTQWRVMEVCAGFNNFSPTIHLVGYAGYEGRVCSAVKDYDPKSKRAVTKSGRVYALVGSSGYNGDALYTWDRWFANLGSDATMRDITERY
jgi:hypothetical protein